jgi:choline kinase
MIGLVLAAGKGDRLKPLTEALPKTLLPVRGEDTILDLTLANLRAAGIERAAIVTGFAAGRIEAVAPELERRHGVELDLVFNDHAEDWNNAYSLWVARDRFAEGALLVNGDTVAPAVVMERLLAARGPGIVLAVDDRKALGEEEMKVQLDGGRSLRRINKAVDPAEAQGEYIGLTLIEPSAAVPLADALEATWRRDTTLYYEDGYQELVDRGGEVQVAPIGDVEWIEVDNHEDLARARDIACRY